MQHRAIGSDGEGFLLEILEGFQFGFDTNARESVLRTGNRFELAAFSLAAMTEPMSVV